MSNIPFPNVPQVPGVPQVPRSPSSPAIPSAAIGAISGDLWRLAQTETRWGLYRKSWTSIIPVATTRAADAFGMGAALSFAGIDYSKETKVSDFPVEQGGFASYNKVELPASPIVRLSFSGTESERAAAFAAIDAACKSIDLFDVVTPEVKYLDYQLERYNYSRSSAHGVTLLVFEITLKEVRQVSAAYSQSTRAPAPKDVGAAARIDAGKVQPKAVEQSTALKIFNQIKGIF